MRNIHRLTRALFAKEGEPMAPVQLPHTWNAFDGQDGGGDYWRGTGIYHIALPDPTEGMDQYIELGGANHVATVWCNGILLGEHRGGFSTFRFQLTHAMKPENNILEVQVFNGVCDVYPQRADFTFFGGIYRDVFFIETPRAHFDLMRHGSQGVFVTPRSTGNTQVDLFCVKAEGCQVRLRILNGEGAEVAREEVPALPHTCVHMKVEKPRLWQGKEDPYCYQLEATLLGEGQTLDQVCIEYGYRSFRVDPNTGFWLNGKNVPLRGVCRHQDRKDKGWALSPEDHLEDARIIEQIGANTIRLAHYQHDRYFYSLCDRMGFVVWAEIPFISKFIESPEAQENTLSQMRELIAQCYHHPSICFWGIANEITIGGCSEALLDNLRQLARLCKTMDPSRLTTMAQLGSVPLDSDHVYITDVQSYNYYLGWYSGTVEMNGARMDAWHQANPDLAYGISEYGADHYPCWHSAAPFNHDYTEEYALWYHREMLKTFASRPYLWATHLWNMFDFAVDSRDEGGFRGLNAKGLVTHDRKLRKDTFYLYQACWTEAPMVHICGRRFLDRAPGERDVTVLTNEETVWLELNGVSMGCRRTEDWMAVFEALPLRPGENVLVAKTEGAEDRIVLNGVQAHNSGYDVPDILQAIQAGNWFVEQGQTGKVWDHYTVDTPGEILFANPECQQLVQGWLMSTSYMPLPEKMTVVSRLGNYRAMWGERSVREIPAVKRLIRPEDLEHLDQLLRRVKPLRTEP